MFASTRIISIAVPMLTVGALCRASLDLTVIKMVSVGSLRLTVKTGDVASNVTVMIPEFPTLTPSVAETEIKWFVPTRVTSSLNSPPVTVIVLALPLMVKVASVIGGSSATVPVIVRDALLVRYPFDGEVMVTLGASMSIVRIKSSKM